MIYSIMVLHVKETLVSRIVTLTCNSTSYLHDTSGSNVFCFACLTKERKTYTRNCPRLQEEKLSEGP